MPTCASDPTIAPALLQAIDAIIAFFPAVGLPILQARSQRNQLLELIRALIDMAVQRIDWLLARSQPQADAGSDFQTLRLGEITGSLARLPLDRLHASNIDLILRTATLCRLLADFWNKAVERAVNRGKKFEAEQFNESRAALMSLRSAAAT